MKTQSAQRIEQSAGRHAPSAMRLASGNQTIQAFAERVRADLQDHLRVTRKSQATAAKAIGMSDAVISQFLSKGYKATSPTWPTASTPGCCSNRAAWAS